MIIGTAGHIDHGKSALVTALTGRAMDRLAEEQRRGITIDLNFAPLRFDGLEPAGIVDVPGHEDFVRTMVAGASGIDLVLLVVDAAQGPQPQTWEHLAIVEQLAVPRGIPVITKADLAEPDWLELVVAEVEQRLRESPVAFGPPAIVSAVTGQGIPELRERLRAATAEHRRPRPADGFRMPLDRAFSIAGHGTVVTGTPWSGVLAIGDTVTVLPSRLTGRVRSLEAYGAPVSQARPGERTAVGIAGVERSSLRRGEMLVDRRLPWRTTTALDAQLSMLPGAPPLRRQLRLRVHLGTAEVLARVYPRDDGLARLVLESPLVARGGDRFVLRSYSPVVTIGGGRVLDPDPPRRATWPEGLAAEEPAPRMRALVERRSAGLLREELPILLGEAAPPLPDGVILSGGRYVTAGLAVALEHRAMELVQEYHRQRPMEAGISLETLRKELEGPESVVSAVLDSVVKQGRLRVAEGSVAIPGFQAHLAGGEALLGRVLEILEKEGLEPPNVGELEGLLGQKNLLALLRHATQQRLLVAVESDRFFSPAAIEQFVSSLRQLAGNQDITPTALRDKLGLSRKYLIPLLEWADRSGITRRVGNARVLVQV